MNINLLRINTAYDVMQDIPWLVGRSEKQPVVRSQTGSQFDRRNRPLLALVRTMGCCKGSGFGNWIVVWSRMESMFDRGIGPSLYCSITKQCNVLSRDLSGGGTGQAD